MGILCNSCASLNQNIEPENTSDSSGNPKLTLPKQYVDIPEKNDKINEKNIEIQGQEDFFKKKQKVHISKMTIKNNKISIIKNS